MAMKKIEGPPKGRRYVGPRETVGFILFDAAASISISDRHDEFRDRILNISKLMQAAVTPIATAWDVINDIFVAAMVDRTRTRFGKFRPYLVLYPLYGIPASILFYALPYLFLGQLDDPQFMPKIITWALVSMFNELTGTLSGIARTGAIANITPDPHDRLGLINKAQFFSMFGEDLPLQIFKGVRDIISHAKGVAPEVVNARLRSLYLWFGVGTIVVSGVFSVYFAIIFRERVFGTEQGEEKPPSIKESVRGIIRNRPLLLLMLSEILGGFSLKNQKKTYTDAVLNFSLFNELSGIVGSPISYASFAYVPWLRERFSTKTIWLLSNHIKMPTEPLLFAFGLVRSKKDGQRMFLKLWPMVGAFNVQNAIEMVFFGPKRVINEEIRNECIDYGEWKNGFRSEGMTGMLRSLPQKFTNAISTTFTNVFLDAMGFKTGLGYNNQSDSTSLGIFALTTILPMVTSIAGVIPKFLYNVTPKDREVMYAELAARRASVALAMTEEVEGAANG